ncbi:MAG: NAD(P)-dependent oxidoreductase, partial [Pseudolabrys sp.]|nr:NAD(P)-dependent oxidoreductase [Pseudolabrys sp.]
MRIFVAGATGAVGSRLVPRLLSAGHSVIGLTHTPAKAAALRELDVEPVVADALDGNSIHAAVRAAQPDVIIHELTDLKGATDLRRFDRVFAASNRLRTTGTDHLLAAALAAGVKRIVAQSFCGWPYARTGGPVKSEDDALDPNPPREMRRTLDAIRHVERAVTTSPFFTGVVLRYGPFYGPNTGLLEAALVDQVRRRR